MRKQWKIFLFSFNPPLSPFIKGGLRGIIKKRRWWSMKIFFIIYTKISNDFSVHNKIDSSMEEI